MGFKLIHAIFGCGCCALISLATRVETLLNDAVAVRWGIEARHAIGVYNYDLDRAEAKDQEAGSDATTHALAHASHLHEVQAAVASSTSALVGKLLGGIAAPIASSGMYNMIESIAGTVDWEQTIGQAYSTDTYDTCQDDGSEVLLADAKRMATIFLQELNEVGFLDTANGDHPEDAAVEMLFGLNKLVYGWRRRVEHEKTRYMDSEKIRVGHVIMSKMGYARGYQVAAGSLKCVLAILAQAHTPKGAQTVLDHPNMANLQPTLDQVTMFLTGQAPVGCCQKFTNKKLLGFIPAAGQLGQYEKCVAVSAASECSAGSGQTVHFQPGNVCNEVSGKCSNDGDSMLDTLYEYIARLVEYPGQKARPDMMLSDYTQY